MSEELRRRVGTAEPSAASAVDGSIDSGVTSLSRFPSMEGHKGVQIVAARSDHTFELNLEALEDILLLDEVRDKKVVVLSVAGAFRKGKSFLLDFLLRYLNNGGTEGESEWIGSEDEPLLGFSWRGGIERDTTGILMWSKPFFATLPNGEQVAVLLLDTQGAFDNQSTVKDCATIFALSTMVSSVQVFNLSMLIQENDLQHLHLFTEYGRLAMEQTGDIKPFQSLCFLLRDWSFPYEHDYGIDGGKDYLDKVLRISEGQHEEIQVVREHIRSCFESVDCFLMPHPGLKVATNRQFDGRLSDIDSEFKTCLQDLAPLLLSPECLVLKKINGNPVTGRGLLECFKVYMKIYQSEKLPAPKSMLEATAEANNLAALATAFDKYNKDMEEMCGASKPYLAPEKLEAEHERIMKACLDQFRDTRKMGGESFAKSFEERLVKQITEAYENFVKRNEGKHILNAYRTPAVLFTVMVVSYFISSILDMLGIESLSQTAIFGLYIPLLLLGVWGYVRYSGDYREAGQAIDNAAAAIWEKVLEPIYATLLQRGLERAVGMAAQSKTRPKTD